MPARSTMTEGSSPAKTGMLAISIARLGRDPAIRVRCFGGPMVVVGGGLFLMCEVPLYTPKRTP